MTRLPGDTPGDTPARARRKRAAAAAHFKARGHDEGRDAFHRPRRPRSRGARATSRAFDSTTALTSNTRTRCPTRAALRAPRTALTSPAFLIELRDRLQQAGHEIIFQVEHDERCAQVLRTQFPRARLDRHLHSVRELPAETEVLAATLHWPEEGDDDDKERAKVEQSWLPASRAAALEEHAQVFRLLATRPVSWVVLELPVSLLRWATAAVPGARQKLSRSAWLGCRPRARRPSSERARSTPPDLSFLSPSRERAHRRSRTPPLTPAPRPPDTP